MFVVSEEKEKVITEKVSIYPRGRGKILVITEKSVLKKPRLYKRRNPRLSLVKIKSNPQDFSIVSYLNDDIVRYMMFPEGRQLSTEEREKIAIACLISLNHLSPNLYVVGKRMTYKREHKVIEKHYRISQDFRLKLDVAFKRYLKWRRQNN